MNELIREAADFYMNVYPQLTHGVEYKKIGIALINEYPCLACEDTINPHVSRIATGRKVVGSSDSHSLFRV